MGQRADMHAQGSAGSGQAGLGKPLAVPPSALEALAVLEGAGFEAWLVGGFVRDALLGRPCADIDIATRAPWQEVRAAFERRGMRTHETGCAHGTVTAVVAGRAFEVTTYRCEGGYADARHPDEVRFVRTIEEDLARRDFTVNAMAYHPERGLLDPFGGRADLEGRVIRAVGEAAARFSEDALRILRACRFAAELGFAIEQASFFGMVSNKGLLARISVERIRHELSLLLLGPHAGDSIVANVDVLAAVLPELVSMKGFDQHTPYHIYDVLRHTAHVVDATPPYPLVRWAALFHDAGKPASFFVDSRGRGHFYGHAAIGVMLARGALQRLSFSTPFIDRVLALVRHHDDEIKPTGQAVKRMLVRLGGDPDLFSALCDLKRGDAQAQAPRCFSRVDDVDELELRLEGVLAADEAFTLKKLAIKGDDVTALGVAPGPRVGQALRAALDAVVDGLAPNEPEALRRFVADYLAGQEGGPPSQAPSQPRPDGQSFREKSTPGLDEAASCP